MIRTLWDLLRPRRPVARRAPAKEPPARREPGPMQQKYERMTRDMLDRYGVRVRKWRTGMSGIAWEIYYHDGRTVRLIEAPRPKGPMSAAIFLHEIGHHAIGFGRYSPRCLEEFHAWRYSLEQMKEHGITVTAGVERRVRDSLRHAVAKARRRGLRHLPRELEPYAS